MWKFHGKGKPFATIRVRHFRIETRLEFSHGARPESLAPTHLRIKALLSGVFNRAKQVGAISGVNPIDNTKAGGQRRNSRCGLHAGGDSGYAGEDSGAGEDGVRDGCVHRAQCQRLAQPALDGQVAKKVANIDDSQGARSSAVRAADS